MADRPRRRKALEPNARPSDASETAPAPPRRSRDSVAFRILAVLLVLAGVIALASFARNVPSPQATGLNAVEDWFAGRPFAVQDIPGRGKGLVATRDIERGTLLVRERPLFRVPLAVETSPTELIRSHVAALSAAERAAFFGLSFVNMPPQIKPGTPEYDDYLPLAIFQTNTVSAGDNMAGIFPLMARLNHGCSFAFNTVYSWREDEGVLVVHALKDIKTGEELLTTYTDTKRARAERQHLLQTQYAFKCACACCVLPLAQSRASDARLTFMAELYRAFAGWGTGALGSAKAVDVARKLWHVGGEEGYTSERGRLAADVAHVAAAAGDEDAARQWALLGERWAGYELGNDSSFAREMRTYAADPQTHPMWGAGDKEAVGGPGEDMV